MNNVLNDGHEDGYDGEANVQNRFEITLHKMIICITIQVIICAFYLLVCFVLIFLTHQNVVQSSPIWLRHFLSV